VRGQRGFTLIELLCALTILAAVLAVSVRILSGAGRNAAAAADYGQALTLASAHLAGMEAADHVVPGLWAGNEAGLHWEEEASRAGGEAFADAGRLKLIAWRLRVLARTAQGREVTLTSVRLERPK